MHRILILCVFLISSCSWLKSLCPPCDCKTPTDGGVVVIPDAGVTPDKGTPAPTPTGTYAKSFPWAYEDISQAPLEPNSSTLISAIGGWGFGKMMVDFSMVVVSADTNTPKVVFQKKPGEFWDAECDYEPVPLPHGGAIENESSYHCASDGDCHLLVVHPGKLYEMWRANVIPGGAFMGGCMAVWDLSKTYNSFGRGKDCTSADAAGLPIVPLLFTADEVFAGEIPHAIRFILPPSKIRKAAYVSPASHGTNGATGGAGHPPYGARLRLRSSFDVSVLKSGAKVVARAMQKYGMFLSDAGNVALTAMSDRFSSAKWGDFESNDLNALKVSDFEVVKHRSDVQQYTGDCVK